MKVNIQKAIRVIIPVFVCAFVLFCSVVPVYAYDYPFSAGKYTIVSDVEQPRFSFDVSLRFTSNNTTFDSIRFVDGTDSTFPSLRFGYTVVVVWRQGVPEWVSDEYRNIVLLTDQTVTDPDFTDWLYANSTHYSISDDTKTTLGDYLGVVWETLGGYWSGTLLPDAFSSFASVLSVFWESPIIMRIVTLSVAFLVAGFVVFGESKHG